MAAADFSAAELDRLQRAGRLLLEAEDRLPVLKTIAWDRSHAEAFFASGESELPDPVYPRVDPEPSLERIAAQPAVAPEADASPRRAV